MHEAPDKLAGLLDGSLIGDALALGAHWIYDQDELRRDFGRVTDFLDPREDYDAASFAKQNSAASRSAWARESLR